MRILFAVGTLLACVICLRGDDVDPADDADVLVWKQAFSSSGPIEADESLMLVLITNDDPMPTELSASGGTEVDRQHWCEQSLARAVLKARQRRGDLKELLVFRSMAAGMPAVLTGGKLRNQPARAVVAVCDNDYRLLALTVGVPDVNGILSLVEDAEEVMLLRKLHPDARQEMITALVDRSSKRVSRVWRAAIEKALLSVGADAAQDGDESETGEQKLLSRLRLTTETFDPTYLNDVQLRYGLTEEADRTRLVVLEQHPQSRRPWCESMIPFFAGEDFQKLWNPLCAQVWGLPPVSSGAEARELLDWWDLNFESESMVLALQKPQLAGNVELPKLESAATQTKRGVTWDDIQTLAQQHQYRRVTAEELAVLFRAKELRPVDLQLPTKAKYLVFEPRNLKPLIIREGDRPAKFVGRLKRATPSETK